MKTLVGLLQLELQSVPVEHWREFFPVQVAVMRLLAERFPDRFALKRAGFDADGPYLVGQGVDWFYDHLWDLDALLALVERVMVEVAENLKQRFPGGLDCAPHDIAVNVGLVEEIEVLVLREAASPGVPPGA